MRLIRTMVLASLAFAVVGVCRAHAQISLAPMFGVYSQANSASSLKSNANELRYKRESKLGLGLAAELGPLRGTLAYVSGANITDKGTTNTANVGEGTILNIAADFVLRPIPRMVVFQPYIFAGAGYKNQDYNFSDSRFNAFPSDDRDFALHAGIGADVMFGGFGIVAEINDFISKDDAGSFNTHDGFGFVGLKARL